MVFVLFVALALSVSPMGIGHAVAQDQATPPSEQEPPPPPPASQTSPPAEQSTPLAEQALYAKLSADQLDRLVAPIALYPDAVDAQILASSTFPSQIVDAEAWLKSHPGLSPTELASEVDKQPWDPSVKALVQYPSVLQMLADNLGWTSELGDAYYNQPQDVMKAIQRMRKKAKKAGTLKSTPQLKVEEQGADIVIAPANPEVVYIPAYDPWIVYGFPIAPWPYWVAVPGLWWSGPGIYFSISFYIGPFFRFGWGWPAWAVDWHHWGIYYHHAPFFPRGPAFFDRRAFYGGRPGFARPDAFRGGFAGRDFRGFAAPRNGLGIRSGAFSGIGQGGMVRGFSAVGQSSFGGFRGGGFAGGGFHGFGGRR